MRGRTPAQAVRGFRDTLQLALSSVTRASLLGSPGIDSRSDVVSLLTLGDGSVRLGGQEPIGFRVRHWFRLVEERGARDPWLVQSTGYAYQLESLDGPEILAYHWHPQAQGQASVTHLHLGSAAGALRRQLQRAHLPTGWVSRDDVIALAIESFDVRPLRPDWRQILARTRAAALATRPATLL